MNLSCNKAPTRLPGFDAWQWLRPLLFRLDPELAHRLTLTLAEGWARLLDRVRPIPSAPGDNTGLHLMGVPFPNAIGLAAGLDKDATAVHAWQRLGFGFVEVGTVTAYPQPGNPRPRLFRFPPQQALVNRMGFNNQGADRLAERLDALRANSHLRIPLGVNIGKSKRTPAAEAAGDYCRSFARLGALADYVAVNLSSPNTPGLRRLQSIEDIKCIVSALQELNQKLSQPRPLLVKLAPDLTDAEAIDCARAALAEGCAGLILTNTTTDFSALPHPDPRCRLAELGGGLSGQPLFARSTALLKTMRDALGPHAVLIGVGGILSPEDAAAKFTAGANLVQIYTGIIYQGPALIRQLVSATTHVQQ